MSLTVKCPGCDKALRVPDTAAGKTIKCPLCAKLFKLPDATAAPAAVTVAPPVPSLPRPPAPPRPPQRPDAVRRATEPPEEDELELEPSAPQALPFLPIEFKATVKDRTKTMKGVYQGKVSRAGIVLRQGKKVVEVPVGTEAEYIKANRMAVELEQGRVELTVVKLFHYFNQLTEDLVAFLNGDKQALDARDYRMPWYLYVPAVLPLGIPIITIGGALPTGIAAGLAGACFGIAQQKKMPVAARIAASVALSVVAYTVLFVLIGLGKTHSWVWSPGIPESQWKTFTSAEGRFRVEMPGDPKPETKAQMVQGAPMTERLFKVDLRDSLFVFGYLDIPAGLDNPFGENLLLDMLSQGAVVFNKGKVKSSRHLNWQQYPGREVIFDIEEPRGKGILRMYQVNQRFYQLWAVSRRLDPDSKDVQRFLNSFSVVQPAAGRP